MSIDFSKLHEGIKISRLVEASLSELARTKTYGEISISLYQMLDGGTDLNIQNSKCCESFRGWVMKHQSRKNHRLLSSPGFALHRVNESRFNWQKTPSVRPKGKQYFWYLKANGKRWWVAWSRADNKWLAMDAWDKVHGKFDDDKVGKKFVEGLISKGLPVEEAVASKLPPIQQDFKKKFPSSLNLPVSTWSDDKKFRKFLILNDGYVIPVESSHKETIATRTPKGEDSHSFQEEVEDSGVVVGNIDVNNNSLIIYTPKWNKLTQAQIESLIQICAKYDVGEFWLDNYPDKTITGKIKSASHLRMFLQDGPEFMNPPVTEGLVDYAKDELNRVGLFDKDADYDGDLGDSVLKLIKTFARQDHSGGSAAMVRELFAKLSSFKPLSPITNNADEWMDLGDQEPSRTPTGTGGLWQSRRNPSLFSEDAGSTYYDVEEWEKAENDPHKLVVHKSEVA